MKRYCMSWGHQKEIEDQQGEWCRYEDVAALEAENAMLIDAISKDSKVEVIINQPPLPGSEIISYLLKELTELRTEAVMRRNPREYYRYQGGGCLHG